MTCCQNKHHSQKIAPPRWEVTRGHKTFENYEMRMETQPNKWTPRSKVRIQKLLSSGEGSFYRCVSISEVINWFLSAPENINVRNYSTRGCKRSFNPTLLPEKKLCGGSMHERSTRISHSVSACKWASFFAVAVCLFFFVPFFVNFT